MYILLPLMQSIIDMIPLIDLPQLYCTRRVPVEGKSSVCLIRVKYSIIILIIIIISLGEIVLLYIANTSRPHARTHTHTRTHERTHANTYTPLRSGSMCPWRPSVTKCTPSLMAVSWITKLNTRAGDPIYPRFWMFFAYTKLLGRTETRTRDRMYCQSIRTVIDI